MDAELASIRAHADLVGDAALAWRDNALAERERRVAAENALSDAHIGAWQRTAQERATHLAELARKDVALAQRDATIAQKQEEIDRLTAALAAATPPAAPPTRPAD